MKKAELRNVTKVYDGKTVLSDYSVTIENGKRYCVMGPSGSGKTTLLRLLTGLEKPDKGEAVYDRTEVKAWVFQEDRLIPHLNAVDNCALVTDRPDRTRIEALLTEAGLGDSLTVPVRNLSGGMARRAAVVRALTSGADCLIMDEPLKGLDEATKQTVLQMISRETKGKTLVYVTHDRSEYEALGGELIELT